MADEPVVLTRVDPRGVATVTLNRPQVHNAYNGEVVGALLDGLPRLAADDAVRVIVLRANGKHFQAGADLTWLREVSALPEAQNLAVSRRTTALARALNEVAKPTVAAVHGACVGGGVGLVACCDVAVASDDATFAVTEARWGMAASPIIPQLVAAIGLRAARRYALTGERFDAATAKAIGLVHEVCARDVLDATVAAIVDALLLSPPSALAVTKRRALAAAAAVIDDDLAEHLAREHAAARMSPEAADGLASFAEKRPPAWHPRD